MTDDNRGSQGNRGSSKIRAQLLDSLRAASVTMLAALLTLASALAIQPGAGSGVMAVVLALSLSRSQLDRDRRGRIEAALILPLVGLLAVSIAFLLVRYRWLGALLFVGGMFLSIWLRRFGAMTQRAGALIALPFFALLTTPYIPSTSSIPAPLVPVLIALLALFWVSVVHALAVRMHILQAAPASVQSVAEKADSPLRPIASTRMAIQMAMALMLSFVIGFMIFPERWSWIVLTTMIVLTGNRGRLDVAYKSVLRVIGAAAGTVIALSLSAAFHPQQFGSQMAVPLILLAMFLALWLRPLGYGWWALLITIALALLQEMSGVTGGTLLLPRLEEILIGAVIGVATAWLVLPVRTTGVLRRQIALALAALSDALDPANEKRRSDEFIGALTKVALMLPSFRASRLFTQTFLTLHPADWIDILLACQSPAVALIDAGQTPGDVRRAVGAARKVLREPADISAALQNLRGALQNAAQKTTQKTAQMQQEMDAKMEQEKLAQLVQPTGQEDTEHTRTVTGS
ncbi:MAG: FUSC family protein [Burkholderiales bacterium]|nr:FUSC family protein [Burkholderiales bacterium]